MGRSLGQGVDMGGPFCLMLALARYLHLLLVLRINCVPLGIVALVICIMTNLFFFFKHGFLNNSVDNKELATLTKSQCVSFCLSKSHSLPFILRT